MLAIVAPGQGAQTPGFLEPWLADSRSADQLAGLSSVTELDLVHYGTGADADTIRDTAVAQPLLVAAGLLSATALFGGADAADLFGEASAAELVGEADAAEQPVGVLAGHSVGELTAAAIAGVLTAEQAMLLVRERGRAMAEASAATPTSMTAMVGGDPAEVLAAIERHGLTAANNNGTGQIVAAGTTEQLAALAEDAPRRCRLVPLSVAGAFHTHHMAPAVAHLEQLAATVEPGEPRVRLLSNADGAVVRTGADALQRIVGQVANPVRWDRCMQTMQELGVTGLLELTPAGTLSGIAKRNLKGVELFALNTPDQLADAQDFVRRHGGPAAPADQATEDAG